MKHAYANYKIYRESSDLDLEITGDVLAWHVLHLCKRFAANQSEFAALTITISIEEQ